MRRSPFRAFPGRRTLLAAGLAAAVVLVPTTAHAEPGDVTTETLSAQVVPDELRDAVDELAAVLGIPQKCVEGVSAGIDLIIEGLSDVIGRIPVPLEDLLAMLRERLGELAAAGGPLPDGFQELRSAIDGYLAGPPVLAAESLAPGESVAVDESVEPAAEEKIIAGLTLLGKTLTEDCKPTASGSPTTSSGSTAPAATTSSGYGTPTQPQQVVYPGYAPTGVAAPEESSSAGPLATLGAGVLLLGGATAVGYRRRGRAARTEG